MSRLPTWRWPTACLVALVASASASGREIHYGAAADPALLACDVLEWRGKLSAAEDCYRDLLGSDREAAVRAEAAWALDDLQLANRLFRDAAARYPDEASIRVRWGDLFADSHQDTEAIISTSRRSSETPRMRLRCWARRGCWWVASTTKRTGISSRY